MLSCCTCHFLFVYRWFRYLSPDPCPLTLMTLIIILQRKGSDLISYHQNRGWMLTLYIQIFLYTVKHICIKSHFVSIVDNEIDFSFKQGVIYREEVVI